MDSGLICFQIADRSFVAYAKREIHQAIAASSFSAVRAGEIDIIVSEMASNLIKHGKGGELLFRFEGLSGKEPAIEFIAIDNGVGISDITRMMKDGTSTSSTLGQGLGALQRLSNLFEIFSMPGWGTIAYCNILSSKSSAPVKLDSLSVKGLCVPKANETVCGDGYAVNKNLNHVKLFFGDGLGHGEAAHHAVKTASEFFMASEETDPVTILRQMHEHIRRTRGLVGAIAVHDIQAEKWRICGIGNIMTRIYSGIEYKTYMSYNGTVGLNIPNTMNSTEIASEKNQRLVMCSDGIRSGWDITRYPAIMRYNHAILGAVIYKDFNRKTDDASILIASVNQ